MCSSRVGGGPVEADLSRNVEWFDAPKCGSEDIDLPTPRRVREVDSLNGRIAAMEEEASLLKSIFELVSELRVEHVASRAIC